MKIRRFKLKRVNVFPTFITVGNLLCGFGALSLAATAMSCEGRIEWVRIEWASYLILCAMIFDLLDGQVARITGAVSRFGGEMDSLADLVSFGAAPAMVAKFLFDEAGFPSRFGWVIGALFVVCGALRLARYNVETAKLPKNRFSGLPIPGAAGCVASVVILRSDFLNWEWALPWGFDPSFLAPWLARMLPYLMIGLAVLMVSRLPYPHLGHKLFRGKRPFTYLVGLLLAMVLLCLHHEIMLCAAFNGYMLVGPMALLRRQLARARGRAPAIEARPGKETPG